MLELDRYRFDVTCPNCRFANQIFYRDARLRDVLICRGCKKNIQLDDHMNQCRKARSEINAALQKLQESLGKLSGKITIKL